MIAYSRIFVISTALLFGCDVQPPPPADLMSPADNDLSPSHDLTGADLAPGPCDRWTCTTDHDCPPSLCATASEFGICRNGLCRW